MPKPFSQIKKAPYFLGCLLAFMSCANVYAQAVYSTEHILDERKFHTVTAMAYADLDNDGLEDILIASQTPNRLFIKKQNANGNYDEAVAIGTTSATWLEIVDLNKDGLLDILFLNSGDLAWIKNLGNSTYSQWELIGSGFYGFPKVKVGDFQNDGVLDIVVNYSDIASTGVAQSKLAHFVGDGVGNWTFNLLQNEIHSQNSIFTEFSSTAVDLADIDNDGDLDIVFSGLKDENFFLRFAENIGNNNFQIQELADDETHHNSISLVDLDNDGDIDIFFDTLIWYSNQGGANFELGDWFINPNAFGFSYRTFWYDNDADGVKDLFVLDDEKFRWWKNDGNLVLTGETEITYLDAEIFLPLPSHNISPLQILTYEYKTGLSIFEAVNGQYGSNAIQSGGIEGLSDMLIIDLEGDGDMDVLCAKENVNGLSYFVNSGQGVFDTETNIPNADSNILGIETAFINDDDLADIVFHGVNHFGFQINNGDLTFGDPVIREFTLVPPGPSGDYLVNVNGIATADLNLNGLPDLVVHGYQQLSIFYDFTESGFENVYAEVLVTFQDFETVGPISLLDLDGDGYKDIIEQGSFLGWRRNTANGFEPEPFPFPQWSGGGFIVDFNQDGALDFVERSQDNFTVFLNEGGAESFEEITISIPTHFGFSLEVFDLNDDDVLDLAYVTSNGYRWSQGISDTEFYHHIDMTPTPPSFRNFQNHVFFDIDGDNDIDLLTSELIGNKMSWFEFNPESPIARFEFELDAGNKCDVDSVQFYNTSIAYFSNCSWEWDFDDGNTSNELSPKHFFTSAGIYNPILTICNEHGCSATSHTVEVLADLVVDLDFDIPTSGVVGEEILFFDSSQNVTNWSWIFGDGDVSLEQSPTHVYDEPGIYTIELFLTNSNVFDCTFSFTETIEIAQASSIDHPDLNEISVKPNPFIDYVDIVSSTGKITSYQLYDVNGAVLQHGPLSGDRLNIPNLPRGIYLIRLEFDGGGLQYRKLVKR